jgi:hypothetical protein
VCSNAYPGVNLTYFFSEECGEMWRL